MDAKFTKALQQDLSAAQDDTAFQEEPAFSQEMLSPPQRDTAAEFEEFKQEFPHVYALAQHNSKCIPEEVWAMVRQGMSLTEALHSYLDNQQDHNTRNARRSAGSMRSAGRNTSASDPFLRGFYSVN